MAAGPHERRLRESTDSRRGRVDGEDLSPTKDEVELVIGAQSGPGSGLRDLGAHRGRRRRKKPGLRRGLTCFSPYRLVPPPRKTRFRTSALGRLRNLRSVEGD